MLDVTPQEWILFAVVTSIASAMGYARFASQSHAADLDSRRIIAQRAPSLSLGTILFGGPFSFWLTATPVLGLLGLCDSLAKGRGFEVACRNAMGVGLLYGFGAAFYGCPFVVLSGCLAAWRRGCRRVNRPIEEIDVGSL